MRRTLVLFLSLAFSGPLLAAPVAVMTTYSGTVKITRGGKPVTVKAGLPLESGDKVQVSGGRAVLFFLGAAPKTLTGNSAITVTKPKVGSDGNTWGKVYTGLSRGFSGQSRTGMMAMRPDAIKIVYPQNTLILEQQPIFEWEKGGADAREYEVIVNRAGGAPLWHATTEDTTLVYPKTAPPLDGVIEWQVIPLGAGKQPKPESVSPLARFRVATAAETRPLQTHFREIDQALQPNREMQALAKAAVSSGSGFVAAAIKELKGLDTPTAKALRASFVAQSQDNSVSRLASLGLAVQTVNLPDVSLDPGQIPAEVRKTFIDKENGFSIAIPLAWGERPYDIPQNPDKTQARDLQLMELGVDQGASLGLSLAIERQAKVNRPLLPFLFTVMRTVAPLRVQSTKNIKFQNRAATMTDWVWDSKPKKVEGQSLEFFADGRNWVLSVSDENRKRPEFKAAIDLFSTWSLVKPGANAPAVPTLDEFFKEMKEEVLAKGASININRQARWTAAPTRDLAAAEAALNAATPETQDSALKARVAAITAGALSWDALQKGDTAESQRLLARRQELLARSYADEKAFYLKEIAATDRRISELSAMTPLMPLTQIYNMVLDGWMGVQGFRTDDLQILAKDNGDYDTYEAMAKLSLKYSLRQLRKSPFSTLTLEQQVDKRMAVIRALGDLGDVAETQAKFDLARAHYFKTLELRRTLPAPPEKRDEDEPLRSLAAMESRIGNQVLARRYYELALAAMDGRKAGREAMIAAAKGELQTIMLGEMWQGYNVLYNNLGIIAHGQGDYEAARRYYELAVQSAEKMPSEGFSGKTRANTLGRSTANLATLLADSGETEAARKGYDRAIELYRSIGDDKSVAFTMLNVAGLLNDEGDTAGARRNIEAARALYSKSDISRDRISADIFLARIERQEGNFARAEELALEALKMSRARGDLEYISMSARAVADARFRAIGTGDTVPPAKLDAIWEPLREAEAADQKSGMTTSRITSLILRAKVQDRAGDQKAAVASLRVAIDEMEAVRATAKSSEAFSEQKNIYEVYDLMVRLLLELNMPDEAFDYLQRARSKKLKDSLRLDDIKTQNPALRALLDRANNLEGRLRTVQAQLAEEKARPGETQDIKKVEALTALVASTQKEFFNVSTQIEIKYPNYSKVVSVKPKELKKAQKALPDGALLLQYAPLGDKLYIFSVTKDDLKIYTPAVEPATLKAKIREFRREIDVAAADAAAGRAPMLSRDPATRKTLTTLYDMLLAPVAEDIAKANVVAIIPTQELYYLPFHALAREDAAAPDGLRFFIEDKTVAYLAAADVLAVVQPRNEARLGKGLLALGDPTGAGQQGSLPEARAEVNAIAKLYPATQALVGENATKAVLLQENTLNRRALHLAAHGVLDSVEPERSFIQLAPSGGDDGKLRMGEIYGLDLNSVDLVTLSACRTALGEGAPDGSEITSLADSFSSAGTPTVVASLWSVEDQSTRHLMEAFYKTWAGGQPKAASMRAAQISLLKDPKTRHPFYWAPFEVLGDWR